MLGDGILENDRHSERPSDESATHGICNLKIKKEILNE